MGILFSVDYISLCLYGCILLLSKLRAEIKALSKSKRVLEAIVESYKELEKSKDSMLEKLDKELKEVRRKEKLLRDS